MAQIHIVHKVVMQGTDIKFISIAYNACEMAKQRIVIPIKVNSIYAFSVYSEFNRKSIEMGLCVQFFLPSYCLTLPFFID